MPALAEAPVHTPSTAPTLLHELQAQRFSRTVGGELCSLRYNLDGDTITFTHTYVPESLRGHGIAAELVEAGMAWARAEGLRVASDCSYAHAFIQKQAKKRAA